MGQQFSVQVRVALIVAPAAASARPFLVEAQVVLKVASESWCSRRISEVMKQDGSSYDIDPWQEQNDRRHLESGAVTVTFSKLTSARH